MAWDSLAIIYFGQAALIVAWVWGPARPECGLDWAVLIGIGLAWPIFLAWALWPCRSVRVDKEMGDG